MICTHVFSSELENIQDSQWTDMNTLNMSQDLYQQRLTTVVFGTSHLRTYYSEYSVSKRYLNIHREYPHLKIPTMHVQDTSNMRSVSPSVQSKRPDKAQVS